MPQYIYNPITLQYEVHEGPRWHRPARIVLAVVAVMGLCWFYFWLFTSVFGWDLPKTARLKREAAEWQTKISVLDRKLNLYETSLEGIEDRDDRVYRSIYGLTPQPADARSATLGGTGRYEALEAEGADAALRSAVRRTDNLVKRAHLQSMLLDEVQRVSLTAGDMISHIPGVPPIVPEKGAFHLASPFGRRIDPVYGGTRFHDGQDFACPTGTPVYSTGDGVVVKADFKFTGYGNEIVIDHGFGYRTRYAHLSKIGVAVGTPVRRGDQIGAVGSTGKSTGPHLHYEVLYRNTPVNPWQYMNLDMSADEYKAMVESRRRDALPHRKSSLELLDSHNER